MSGRTFQRHYEQMTDDEFALVVADKQDLVPEAVEALDWEIQRRHFLPPEPPQWIQPPNSQVLVESLEDYEEYRRLTMRKKTFDRYWYLFAMWPFVLGLVLGKTFFENSVVLVVAALAWAICVAIYGLIMNMRFLGFRCPQCSQGFGRGAECFNCGFPRSTKKGR
jgi:hypothetical protein